MPEKSVELGVKRNGLNSSITPGRTGFAIIIKLWQMSGPLKGGRRLNAERRSGLIEK